LQRVKGGKGKSAVATEQDRTLEAIKTAIQMEINGKEYYLKASQASSNELGRKLLQQLAAEEDVHRQKFEQIFNAISAREGWPRVDYQPDGGQNLRTIFARATQETGTAAPAPASELDAVKTAMDMENKTYDFYNRQAQSAAHDAEKGFYQSLMAQEREHHLVLLDYYEYLKDPPAWFVKSEHQSLDGG